ncbi:NUDIX domain-containing protein [Bradymonadaceae bacterium TMQ3]|nr:NUDIX domain-containing protein [Bradymonadaceae bacterium TMQ3]TXC75178.1 NUDIX domain-containing protein [Bradymonadales bacterium TMQ1]
MDEAVKVRDAATVMLMRDGGSGLEVLLMRRHSGHAFMADRWVFPGGRVDARDGDAALKEAFSQPFEAAAGLAEDEDAARALTIAALREVFEETGVLLAQPEGRAGEDGPRLSAIFEADRERWQGWRQKLDEGSVSMVAFLDALKEACGRPVRLNASGLHYYARWITPGFESRRYDTRFFVARAPAGQAVRVDARELVESRWFGPEEAIMAYRRGEILLAPPTLCVLEDLQHFQKSGGVDALVAELEHASIDPILPQLLEDVPEGDEAVLLLPGDAAYREERVDVDVARCPPGRTLRERSGVTRVVRRSGLWWTERG